MLFLVVSCDPISLQEALSEKLDNNIELEDGVSPTDHRVFLSSSISQANLGGFEGANIICNNLAQQAGLQKSYKALLGVSGMDPLSNISDKGGKLYTFTSESDKRLVADSLLDFVENNIKFDAKYDESYTESTINWVWTGIDLSGVSSSTCNDWTSSAFENARGGRFHAPQCEPADYSAPNAFDAFMHNNQSDCETNGFIWNDMIGFNSVGSGGGITCIAEAHIYCISE